MRRVEELNFVRHNVAALIEGFVRMANDEHLKIIKQGVDAWNAWREQNPVVLPHLSEANLSRANLFKANLSAAGLSGSHLFKADLSGADLRRADLHSANLRRADLRTADLTEANLHSADLREADLRKTDLSGADLRCARLGKANLNEADLELTNLSQAELIGADFTGARLSKADFSRASFGWTVFGKTDLSTVKGLDHYSHHYGPSTIGVDTLYLSQGHIPEFFLRDAGLPEEFITQIPALVESVKPIQFQSCFISYSHRDEEFAKRLHSAMRSKNLRVWFAAEDMKGGKKLHEEIFRAIQIHDRLLLVLSPDSMKSEWVASEIHRARKVEREENRRKLFPIRLADFEVILNWECFDADSGRDLAIELREYYIPDFSNWKDHDSFEREFAKLLRDLKATES